MTPEQRFDMLHSGWVSFSGAGRHCSKPTEKLPFIFSPNPPFCFYPTNLHSLLPRKSYPVLYCVCKRRFQATFNCLYYMEIFEYIITPAEKSTCIKQVKQNKVFQPYPAVREGNRQVSLPQRISWSCHCSHKTALNLSAGCQWN